MSKFHTVSEDTLSCGIGVINAFGLYCDEDDKTNHNIVIVSYRGVQCGYSILTFHPNKLLGIFLQQFGGCFVHL